MQMKLARTIEELTGARVSGIRREAEQDVVALALAVARRILHRELTVAPEALLGLVKAALEKMEAREVHRVRVSPSDAATVRQFFEQMGLPQRVEVVADASLAPGGVLIDSSRGVLDASVDTQLAEIERGFADLVRSGAHELWLRIYENSRASKPAAGRAASPSWSVCWWNPKGRKRRWAISAKSARARGA